MLGLMRRALKRGLLQVVIWVTLAAMILAYSGSDIINLIQRIFGLEPYAVMINKIKISPEAFRVHELEAQQSIDSIKKQYGPYAPLLLEASGLSANPKELALMQVIQQTLINATAFSLNIQLDPTYIRQSLIKELPKEMIDEEGNIDAQALASLLNNLPLADFERRFEEDLRQQLVLDLVEAALFIPSFEANAYYGAVHALKKYAVLVFPLSKFVTEAKKETATAEELKKFFNEQNKLSLRYQVPEKRVANVWEFSRDAYTSSPSKADIEAYYNKNKQQFLKQPAQLQARRILLPINAQQTEGQARQKGFELRAQLIKDPSLFADYAKKHSADKKTADKGGLMDFVTQGQLERALDQAAFALEKDNQISDIVQTEEGISLLQRVARKAPIFKPLSEVEADIKKAIDSKRFNATFPLEAKRAVRTQDGITELASAKSAKEQQMTVSAQDKSALVQHFFKIARVGGTAFFVDGDKGFIVALTDVQKEHVPPFDKVKEQVGNDFYQKKAEAALQEALTKAKAEAAAGKKLEGLGGQFGATLLVTPFINKESAAELEKLQKQQVPLQELFALTTPGAMQTSVGKDGYLMKLEEIKQPEENKTKRKETLKNIFLERRNALQKGFIASLEKTATIKVNISELDKKIKTKR